MQLQLLPQKYFMTIRKRTPREGRKTELPNKRGRFDNKTWGRNEPIIDKLEVEMALLEIKQQIIFFKQADVRPDNKFL